MEYYAQCDIVLQNCNAVWPRATTGQAPFTNTSCVRDNRLPSSNVGRCGWAGAPCRVNETVSNCASPLAEVCINGVCAGGVGEPCIPFGDNYTCNSPVNCNVTTGLDPQAICGGEGASVDVRDQSKGLDFGLDYCVSGIAVQNSSGSWTCAAGDAHIPPVSIPHSSNPSNPSNPSTPSTSSTSSTSSVSSASSNNSTAKKGISIGPIVGAVAGGLVLCLILAFYWYRRRVRRQRDGYADTSEKSRKDSSQEPLSSLHKRGLSEQSQATTHTTTSQSHISPSLFPRMFGRLDRRAKDSAVSPFTATAPETQTDGSVVLSQESRRTAPPPTGKTPSGPTPRSPAFPVTSPTFITSSVSLSQESSTLAMPLTVSPVMSPTLPRRRRKSERATGSSHSRTRSNSIPRSLVSVDDVEQRLLALRTEAERGLAEIRAQRSRSEDGAMPPPYIDH